MPSNGKCYSGDIRFNSPYGTHEQSYTFGTFQYTTTPATTEAEELQSSTAGPMTSTAGMERSGRPQATTDPMSTTTLRAEKKTGTQAGGGEGLRIEVTVGIIVGVMAVILLPTLVVCLIFWRKYKKTAEKVDEGVKKADEGNKKVDEGVMKMEKKMENIDQHIDKTAKGKVLEYHCQLTETGVSDPEFNDGYPRPGERGWFAPSHEEEERMKAKRGEEKKKEDKMSESESDAEEKEKKSRKDEKEENKKEEKKSKKEEKKSKKEES